MILRRVIAHVSAQNWLAVFLDFVIGVDGEDNDAHWLHYNAPARDASGDCVIDLALGFSGAAVGNRWSIEVKD